MALAETFARSWRGQKRRLLPLVLLPPKLMPPLLSNRTTTLASRNGSGAALATAATAITTTIATSTDATVTIATTDSETTDTNPTTNSIIYATTTGTIATSTTATYCCNCCCCYNTDYCYNNRLPSTQQTNEGYRGFRKKHPSLMLVEAEPTPGPNCKVRGVRRGRVQVVSKKTPTFANRGLRERMNIEIGGAGGALAPSCECCRWAFFYENTGVN